MSKLPERLEVIPGRDKTESPVTNDIFGSIGAEGYQYLRVWNNIEGHDVALFAATIVHRYNSYEALEGALVELLLALGAERQAVGAFLDYHQDRSKRDEYRTSMYDHRANRERAESRAYATLAKLRGWRMTSE